MARPFGALARVRWANDLVAPEVAQFVVGAASDNVGSGGSVFRVRDRLLDHLEQLATRGPLVLAVDDLQWAEPATLQTNAGSTEVQAGALWSAQGARPRPASDA